MKKPKRLRSCTWQRFIHAPDADLLDDLYVPALSRAVRYDRCCAYFSSRVLATAARGFAGFIETLLSLGDFAPKPAARLIVNEQLDPSDLASLLATGDPHKLIQKLLKQFKTPQNALEQSRLEMLAWLVASGLMEIRVGLTRSGRGILHAKFGVIADGSGDSLVFMGSDNETGEALTANYEVLEISTSWKDKPRFEHYRDEFEELWSDEHPTVTTLPLPEALKQKLIKLAPAEPPRVEPREDKQAAATVMLWHFLAGAPYLPMGEHACDATALVDTWPHQRRVVEDTASAFPAGRLLCDEVGMGKTIEAILVLRRLLCGRGVKRALLLVPAGLLRQWQDELREKGGLLVPRWESGVLHKPNGEGKAVDAATVLGETDLLLLSREWARLEPNRQQVLTAPRWDLVLLDEAHAARRSAQEEREYNSGNLLLQLLRELQLRRRTRGLLLLSATPMQTQPWEPWDLLGVLGEGGAWMAEFSDIRQYYDGLQQLEEGKLTYPTALEMARLVSGDPSFPTGPDRLTPNNADSRAMSLIRALGSQERKKRSEWLRKGAPLGRRMHRNTRGTLRDYYAKQLLPRPPAEREVRDEVFDYADASERACYDAIEHYINERFDKLEGEKKGKGFVMTVYRRRLSSSPVALRRSLGRRLELCGRVLRQQWWSDWFIPETEGLDLRDLSDAGLEESVDPAAPATPEAAENERQEIKSLLSRLEALGGSDSKLDRFLEILEEVTADGRSVLIFTEYADTMEYLRDQLCPVYGTTLGCYSGEGGQVWDGSKWVSVSKADITERLTRGELKVLVCTDAASEGLNLQAASALINYDLPWNPSKVEQRIGRIDRIGQEQAVLPIRNLFLDDSVDLRVYEALRLRCGLFEHFVGPMQPVLSIARDALRRNLRGESVEAFLAELKEIADKARRDAAANSSFEEAVAEPLPAVQPPVTREHLDLALEWMSNLPGGISVTRHKSKVGWRITGLGRRAIVVSTHREFLERDRDVLPFTLGADLISKVTERVPVPRRVPLVMAEHTCGNYRCVEAHWIHADGLEEVIASAQQLVELLQSWDGAPPPPATVIQVEQEARKVARNRAERGERTAMEQEQSGIQRQLEAARLRLLRELGRNLRCLGPGNLNELFGQQLARRTRPDGRYKRALDRLNGHPKWSSEDLQTIDDFVRNLTAKDRQARVALSSELDAALNDPRWIAKGVAS